MFQCPFYNSQPGTAPEQLWSPYCFGHWFIPCLREFLRCIHERVSDVVHAEAWPNFRLFQPLDRVFKRLSLVAEPDSHHLAVVVQLLRDLRHFLAGGVRVFLKMLV